MTEPLSPCPTCGKRRRWHRSRNGLVPMCPTLASKSRCPALVCQGPKLQKKRRRETPPAPARAEVQPAALPRYDQERVSARTCPVCGDPCEGVCADCTARGLR